MMNITWNKSVPPLGGVLFTEYIKTEIPNASISTQWGSETTFECSGQKITLTNSNDVCRSLARKILESRYYGEGPVEKTIVDSWLTFSVGPIASKNDFNSGIQFLDKALKPVTYLAGKKLTIADFIVFSVLYVNKNWLSLLLKKEAPVNVVRWYNHIKSIPSVSSALTALPEDVKTILCPSTSSSKDSNDKSVLGSRPQESKFENLPGTEMGKVVVRFPPEASGYLHIGHAKAALLNQYYQKAFDGKLIMRFDDTNPAKENVHFEKVILEDVDMLEIKPDLFTHTSQYFDLMLEYCEKLLKEGKAYVDDTNAELMKEQREQCIESSNRNNSYEKNKEMWQEMLKGTDRGQKCCVRAKIDMQSTNGCMRDPTIYRCKNEIHPRTGNKYKVYPTYDFACPIVDAIEGVTHTLRTLEYHDRDPQFYWFIDALGLRKPLIWEYSRLSMTNTVLSKRKLTWFVEQGLVDGWDDPRMPTVRGVLRRGMTVEGLKQFIMAQGSSRSVVFMEWDKIWAFNKKVIDPIAPRYTAIEYESPVPVYVNGVLEAKTTAPKHPKNPSVGIKNVWVGSSILIDRADAEAMKEGENTTFINWGNLLIKEIVRENGKVVSVRADPNLENKDYKKTLKLTWLADTKQAPFTPTWCVYFDHIISKPLLGKDEDFKQFVGHETRREVRMLGDPELRNLKKGDIIELQRKGFFRVDEPYRQPSEFTGVEQPVVLFYIPDGSTEMYMPANVQKQEQNNIKNQVSRSATEVNSEIIKQGDVVRNLKAQKANKGEIDSAVKKLLELKVEYKSITKSEWKPDCIPSASTPPANITDLDAKIVAQGEIVRKLKSDKSDKATIEGAVKTLLDLKAQYKDETGKTWCPPPVAKTPCTANDVSSILEMITLQGEKVRDLKAKKAAKAVIDEEVKRLLQLKTDYKNLTGNEWKPGVQNAKAPVIVSEDKNLLLTKIAQQGDKVRDLKLKKANKADVDVEVKVLLELKADFKKLTGIDWKAGMLPEQNIKQAGDFNIIEAIQEQIEAQGNKVRQIKAEKASKSQIDEEVKKLLELKAKFKSQSGEEWKPVAKKPIESACESTPQANDSITEELVAKITAQGDSVRKLKTQKAAKEQIDASVKVLLDLKAEYKTLTGTDFPVTSRTPSKAKEPKVKEAKLKTTKPVIKEVEDSNVKKQTRLGLEARKEENLADWYSQVITKGEMIEYYDVSGCYIFRPWSYSIWEAIKEWFDAEIKALGVQNCYFPIFVSKSVLEKEKTHIADFAPEVAWVTKSGDSDMAEPIAVRPTSETVMYPAYAKWIQSYRDLPIKLNQWNNVVRWEFKHPQPFLRTREFLWQEGHTAYANIEDAKEEVETILDLYAKIYTDLLAIPVIKGRKTEKEKFAGGDYTFTVEAFVSASGRAIQGATSHHLGQNFSKMFDIVYEDPETQEKKFVYQNSWGITTRTIGVMIMVHADNQGLVLPPRVAGIQVVIVPCGITASSTEEDRKNLLNSCSALEGELASAKIKVKGDYRDNYSPGWKFNHWELKGVPVRIELGPKDIKNKQLIAVRRDSGEKITIKRDDAVRGVTNLLENIQQCLYEKACNELKEHTVTTNKWSQFTPNLDNKNIILAPFCGETSCEDQIKADSTRAEVDAEPGAPSMGAKSLCIPLQQPAQITNLDKCIHPSCSRKPKFYTLFGRSY